MSNYIDECKTILPKLKEPFQLVHIRTNPKKHRRLVYVSKKKAKNTPLDISTTHFFALAYDNVLIYALELYVFESAEYVTLFVSKADTTGHFYEDSKFAVSYSALTTALIRETLTSYVNTTKPVRISLFAKSAARYLFPASTPNPRKHILKDIDLIKWWIKTIDPVVNVFSRVDKARVQIPGSDKKAIEACFPKSHEANWAVGDIYGSEEPSEKLYPAVKRIPRFPDDPKSRFLDYLVAENRAMKTSLERFWIELPSRQEFRLGSVVGILGIQGTIKLPDPAAVDPERLAPIVPNKTYLEIYDCLMSLDFSTKTSSKQSTEALFERISGDNIFEIAGERGPRDRSMSSKRPGDETTAVNTLSVGLIRKKPKNK